MFKKQEKMENVRLISHFVDASTLTLIYDATVTKKDYKMLFSIKYKLFL